ncbi:hypothetical protein HN51_055112 [Arachis hypogaea]|uniref:EGF-like domain-containing protein n=1 Tax=Arachis hypogaea TaxID=3818 RepID=A0A6B9V8I3_ARAHY|nr:uncharacterized protein LOC107616570 [Arachis ipaensis]XP_025679797.1 uncharacterized protein LOC112779674 [Arachis hypogaea]QHN77740.1 uncharacterized protein DS421_19g655350 [Arachis hypogaea]
MDYYLCRCLGLTTILFMVLLPIIAKADLEDDILGKICDEVECGKGKCVANTSYPLNFICECDNGWKRTRDNDNDTDANSFLPCVIPQCSMNYGCQSAPPPVPEKSVPHNFSAFDPCYWAYCGEGSCQKNKTHTYRCECNPNTFNLLNISVFPCYSACTIGSNCSKLGIKVEDSTAAGTNGGSSQASLVVPWGSLGWIVTLLISSGLVMWS